MRPNVDPKDATSAGVWFEPRSLWCVKNVILDDYAIGEGGSFGPTLTIPLQRNAFRNGTRFPFQVQRIAISAVGYPLARPDVLGMQAADNAAGPANLNGTCALARVTFQVSSPFRQQWSRTVVSGNGLAPLPTYTPNVPAADSGKSSLFGLNSLMFDRPLIIPRNGAVEWSMSSLQGMRWAAGAGGTVSAFNLPSTDLPMTMSYLEKGGLFCGSARSSRVNLRTNQSPIAPVPGDDSGFPYALPPGFVPMVGGSGNVPFWDPTSTFDASSFRTKNATKAGSTNIYGMTLAIDQTAFDTGVLAQFTDGVVAPVSQRIGTRVRVVGGPATDYWWRPGAPAALVFDTITPAAVFQLDEPITLEPGDSLDVSLAVPAASSFVDGGVTVSQATAASYQFGVSFNGFAAITG